MVLPSQPFMVFIFLAENVPERSWCDNGEASPPASFILHFEEVLANRWMRVLAAGIGTKRHCNTALFVPI